jgi:hypothetical protein
MDGWLSAVACESIHAAALLSRAATAIVGDGRVDGRWH